MFSDTSVPSKLENLVNNVVRYPLSHNHAVSLQSYIQKTDITEADYAFLMRYLKTNSQAALPVMYCVATEGGANEAERRGILAQRFYHDIDAVKVLLKYCGNGDTHLFKVSEALLSIVMHGGHPAAVEGRDKIYQLEGGLGVVMDLVTTHVQAWAAFKARGEDIDVTRAVTRIADMVSGDGEAVESRRRMILDMAEPNLKAFLVEQAKTTNGRDAGAVEALRNLGVTLSADASGVAPMAASGLGLSADQAAATEHLAITI